MDQIAKETLPVSLEEEMRRSYLDYAMSVIVGRALPDVRDGLKPVHRRILYAMHEANNVWNRPYVKCARVVGDVLGKYHPHGDTATYDKEVKAFITKSYVEVPRIPLFQPYLNVALQKNISGYTYWFHRQLDYRSLAKA